MEKILENVKNLFDNGSFIEISKDVEPTVHIGYGTVNDKLVFCILETGGILNELTTQKIVSIYDKAINMGAPIIYCFNNNGINISDSSNMSFYGRIIDKMCAASGVIVQIGIVAGKCLGCSSIMANACDFIFVDKNDGEFSLLPPISIENIKNNDNKMPSYLSKTVLVDNVLPTNEIYNFVRDLIDYLPSNYADNDTYDVCEDDLNRKTEDLMKIDTIESIKQIADYNKYLEIKKEYAQSITTGFIKLNGQTIAVIANNSKDKKICNMCIRKATKMIKFADSFDIPILTIVDVENFSMKDEKDLFVSMPASKLAISYVNATVPKVTLIKNAVGTASFIMGSKNLNIDLVYAFNNSHISIMNEQILAQMLYQDEIENAKDKIKILNDKTNEIKNNNNSLNALKSYNIDDIIANEDSRLRLISAFEMLFTKKVKKIDKKHGAF